MSAPHGLVRVITSKMGRMVTILQMMTWTKTWHTATTGRYRPQAGTGMRHSWSRLWHEYDEPRPRARRTSTSTRKSFQHWNGDDKGYKRKKNGGKGKRERSVLLCRSRISNRPLSLSLAGSGHWFQKRPPHTHPSPAAFMRIRVQSTTRQWASFRHPWLLLALGHDLGHPPPRDRRVGTLPWIVLGAPHLSVSRTFNVETTLHRLRDTSLILQTGLSLVDVTKTARLLTGKHRPPQSQPHRFPLLSGKDLVVSTPFSTWCQGHARHTQLAPSVAMFPILR
jgi:hypothetical protein